MIEKINEQSLSGDTAPLGRDRPKAMAQETVVNPGELVADRPEQGFRCPIGIWGI